MADTPRTRERTTSDVPARLREVVENSPRLQASHDTTHVRDLLIVAADEIERLRREVDRRDAVIEAADKLRTTAAAIYGNDEDDLNAYEEVRTMLDV